MLDNHVMSHLTLKVCVALMKVWLRLAKFVKVKSSNPENDSPAHASMYCSITMEILRAWPVPFLSDDQGKVVMVKLHVLCHEEHTPMHTPMH